MKHFETTIKQLAKDKLPISFLATQWESILTYDKEFIGLPADKNPNVIGPRRQDQRAGLPVRPHRAVARGG